MAQPHGSPHHKRIATRSRYRATTLFVDNYEDVNDSEETVTRSRVIFGTWKPPRVIERRQPIVHIVQSDEGGRPDLLAYRIYRDKSLWWAICARNNIFFPLVDLVPGATLICPHLDDIVAALSSSAASRGT